MTKEQLLVILECMVYALKDKPYYSFTPADAANAKRKLEELIERDTPKEPEFEWKERDGYFPVCPNCKRLLIDGANICDCGQRLKWSE